MKRLIIAIYIILIIMLVIFMYRYLVNEKFISLYENGEYEEENIESLSLLNINEPYIYYYNLGNIYYKNGDFDKAIESYEKALELNKAKEKECDIRINLALAKLEKIDDDYNQEENIDETIDILDDAREVLLEEDCATEDGDGHNSEAQELKEDIDDFEEELKKNKKEENDKDSDKDKDEEQQDNYTEDAKEKLLEKKKQTYENRLDGMETVNSIMDWDNSGYDYYDGKTW